MSRLCSRPVGGHSWGRNHAAQPVLAQWHLQGASDAEELARCFLLQLGDTFCPFELIGC